MNIRKLLGKMTVEEKVKQLCPVWPDQILEKNRFSPKKARKVLRHGIGQVATALRGMSAADGAQAANEIQDFLRKNTRLGIPAIIHDECLHGCMAEGSSIFPQSINIASTWDPELMGRVAVAIGRETRARGITHALSPTINIARDSRCGRTDETYGEDPHLTSRMAVAFIKGLQSEKVVATPKHYAANFVGDGGRDSHVTHFSERIMREIYFPAFEAAVKEAGALSIMAAYNAHEGVPCSCNRWLLTDILRKEWGFKGFVVSDYWSVPQIRHLHKVAGTQAEAGRQALEAGLDVELPTADCFPHLVKLARSGKLSMKALNGAVLRVLWVKEWLGLFDNAHAYPAYAADINDCAGHRELALETARRGIVLLKNDRRFLPLDPKARRVAVVGPNAAVMQTGSYSGYGVRMVSPLEGIRNRLPGRVTYAEGCRVQGGTKRGIAEAVRAAKGADAVIVVAGNTASYGPGYTEGENNDRSRLDLPGHQEALIEAVSAVNGNTAVVLVSGSAVTMEKWANKVRGIVDAWYPGEEGGTAIAEILFGDVNPSGKLPITFPFRTGQAPFYYNAKPSGRVNDYADLRGPQARFAFGHGLSYTSFEYRNTKVKREKGPKVTVSCEVRNKGKRDGDEIVQLYLHDELSSLSRPAMELKGFRRISLEAGARQRVEFVLEKKDFSYLGKNLKPVFEPGVFELMLGASSSDIRLKTKVTL